LVKLAKKLYLIDNSRSERTGKATFVSKIKSNVYLFLLATIHTDKNALTFVKKLNSQPKSENSSDVRDFKETENERKKDSGEYPDV